jgi:hypothetical protein
MLATLSSPIEQAVWSYIRRIRNARKQEYARQYFAHRDYLGDTPDNTLCGAMARQAVMLEIEALLK